MNSKQRLNFLSNVGYFYFACVVFILFGAMALGAYIIYSIDENGSLRFFLKVGAPIGIILFGIFKGFFKAIFSKLPEPDGVEVKKEDALEFYNIVEDICEKTGCPPIHSIKFDFEANAYITEQPSLGIIGGYRRYLVIGLPLLLMLTEKELKAVIAHECGHLSKSHSKDRVKIYRAELIWGRISKELKKREQDRIFLIRMFMERYIPALNDAMFSIGKEHEYQADKIAASIVGGEAIVSGLLKMRIYNAHITNTMWEEIYKLNNNEDKPPKDLFFKMENAINDTVDSEAIKDITEGMLNTPSLPGSTHPSLCERVKALKVKAPEFEETKESSLRQIFNGQADGILKSLSEAWLEDIKEPWKNNYENNKEAEERLTVLNEKHNGDTLSDDETFERAFLIERIEGIESALVAFREIKEAKSALVAFKEIEEAKTDEVYAGYNIGRLMLKQDDEEGLEMLKDTMAADPQIIPISCNAIVNYCCSKGDMDTAAGYYHFAVEFMNSDEDVNEERESLMPTDTFVSNDLSDQTIIELSELLKGYEEIKKAYVVIKHTSLSQEFPVYVIGIDYGKTEVNRRIEIQKEILDRCVLPWEYWVTDLKESRELAYIIDGVPDGRIV